MELLSCRNCCHNPLQLGSIGIDFGFCTRHRVTLLVPHLTTCGQLLRKDLQAHSAKRARDAQRKVFTEHGVSILAEPSRSAADEGLLDTNGAIMADEVVEEVVGYGLLGSKIASMAALHRIPGVRAEIAMMSLGRAYFQNCIERAGRWTSGAHLFQWTLVRLSDEPAPEASDLIGPITMPLRRLIELCKWQIVAFRLALISDIARRAGTEGDKAVGQLASLANDAAEKTQPGSTDSLIRWLRRQSKQLHAAFPKERYETLRRELHEGNEAD